MDTVVDGAGLGDSEIRHYRRRILDAMAECIAEVGYGQTMVADVVRRAKTSKTKFYAEFTDREACLVALLSETNDANLAAVAAAVDQPRRGKPRYAKRWRRGSTGPNGVATSP
ncbi:TetR/AcrR family transcriptional regulator [Mycobacterium sp. HNNTM2301]|uniref:TetR/AcrR family transcriptional regulator n=1 Tax=Mycobacterium hainanense TaxID=3289775 RepID=UPI0035A6E13D